MRRFLLTSLLMLVLAACRKEASSEGAVKLTVTYQGFLPRCVRVSAKDVELTQETRTTELLGKGTATGGTLTVAIFREPTWGRTLELTAEAFESATGANCAGERSVFKSQSVTLGSEVADVSLRLEGKDADGDGFLDKASGGHDCDDNNAPNVHPGATELCNAVDEDCDGDPRNGLNVGQACADTVGCPGTRFCETDGGVGCAALPAVTFYADSDGDKFGTKDGGTPFCKYPDGGFINDPGTGYVSNNTDCDDSRTATHPGAPEICNGLDDNCDNATDEPFNLGAGCTQFINCGGVNVCATDGGVTCQLSATPGTWFPDEDLDTHGKTGASVTACAAPDAGYVTNESDCDDGDPYTYVGATEICDTRDNDCNGTSDDGTNVCLASPAWTSTQVGSDNNREWRSLSLWGDGGVWVVGANNGRAVKNPLSATFTAYETNCTGDWFSVWANPVTGRAFIGGASNGLAFEDPTVDTCTTNPPLAQELTFGMTGFRDDTSGNVTVYGVGNASNLSSGRTFIWDGSSTSPTVATLPTDYLNDIHGVSPQVLFAVGGHKNGSNYEPRIYRFDPNTQQWNRDMTVPTTAGLKHLDAVQVVHSKLAFAVGADGTVFKWDGAAWTHLPFKNTTSELTGVLAFGPSNVYVCTYAGDIYRYNGTDWTRILDTGRIFRDISGPRPDDIWVAADNGLIYHWPK